MSRSRTLRWAFLAALPLAMTPSLTKSAPPASPAAPTQTANTRLLEVVHADNSAIYVREGGRVFVLSGHVHLKEGDSHFYADRVTYYEATKQGEAIRDPKLKGASIGSPVVKDEFHTLTADRMTLDFSPVEAKRKVVSAIGNVKFHAKPKPQAAGAVSTAAEKNQILPRRVKEETVLTCNRMDYYYRNKRGVAEGNLKVVQGKRWLTGNQAIYYKQYETVVVNGNVRGVDEKGSKIAANNMKVVLNGDTETIEADVFTGTFMLEDEESNTPSPAGETDEDRPPVFPGSELLEPAPAPAISPPPADAPKPASE